MQYLKRERAIQIITLLKTAAFSLRKLKRSTRSRQKNTVGDNTGGHDVVYVVPGC
jgi:hypothetical protein